MLTWHPLVPIKITSKSLKVWDSKEDINKPNLRKLEEPNPEVVGQEDVDDFILPKTFITVPAPEKSRDNFWFIQVLEVNRVCEAVQVDDYGLKIPAGMVHHSGHFLERDDRYSSVKATVFKLSKKVTYFYKENILYPFLNIQQDSKERLSLSAIDYTDMLHFIENNGFSHL